MVGTNSNSSSRHPPTPSVSTCSGDSLDQDHRLPRRRLLGNAVRVLVVDTLAPQVQEAEARLQAEGPFGAGGGAAAAAAGGGVDGGSVVETLGTFCPVTCGTDGGQRLVNETELKHPIRVQSERPRDKSTAV